MKCTRPDCQQEATGGPLCKEDYLLLNFHQRKELRAVGYEQWVKNEHARMLRLSEAQQKLQSIIGPLAAVMAPTRGHR